MSEPAMQADASAEQAVIGYVIASGGAAYDDLNLSADDFLHVQHQRLWKAIGAYLATGRVLTPELFVAYLGQHGATELGTPLLDCITANAGIEGIAQQHAENLRLLTARRRIAEASIRLNQLAGSPGDRDRDELEEQARVLVDDATQREARTGAVTTLLDDVMAGLDSWGKPDTEVMPTGWMDLDRLLNGGLRPGHLVIVGARPGVGKSFIATNLASRVASYGHRCYLPSLEMSRREVTNRIASALSGVMLDHLTSQSCTEAELDRLAGIVDRIADWPLVIDDRPWQTVTGIRGRARDITRRDGPLGLIVLDYVQLVQPADPRAPRQEQVASISRGLKLLAKDLHVPVVALAQVNRGSEEAARRRPQMHHLRESGALEADADEIFLLHQDTDDEGELELNVAKNRHGTTGIVNLAFAPQYGRVGNLMRAV